MSEQKYKHHTLPIEATAPYWSMAGYTVYCNTDTVGGGRPGMQELLCLALAAGHQGDQAIAWAVTEENRRREESNRTAAFAADAKAVSDLAASLRAVGEEEMLKDLLGRLTERTQYAVKQQLKGG